MSLRRYALYGTTNFPDGRLIRFGTFRRHDGGAVELFLTDWGARGANQARIRLALRNRSGVQVGYTGEWNQWFQRGRKRLSNSLAPGDYALNGRFYGSTWFRGGLDTGVGGKVGG